MTARTTPDPQATRPWSPTHEECTAREDALVAVLRALVEHDERTVPYRTALREARRLLAAVEAAGEANV